MFFHISRYLILFLHIYCYFFIFFTFFLHILSSNYLYIFLHIQNISQFFFIFFLSFSFYFFSFLKTHFLVCNLPKVPKEKLPILDKVIVEKLLGSCKLTSAVQNSLYGFQQDNKSMTNGSAIFEFNTSENANLAVENLNGVALDKAHTLQVYTMDDFEKIMRIPDEFSAPKILPKSELQKWLCDKELRDQYCYLIQKGNGGSIFVNWFDHLEKKPINAVGEKECIEAKESFAIDWSGNGSYLITLDKTVSRSFY